MITRKVLIKLEPLLQTVLAKVEALAAAIPTSNRGRALTLADLQLPVLCQEVVDKAEDSVLSEIEVALLRVAASILQGHGFAYAIPNRSKGNQLFVPELDRIVLKSSSSQRDFASTSTCRKAVITTRILQLVHELCSKRIHVTKRDLFYTDVKLFEVGTGEVTQWGGDCLG
ncbi:hypothetical protein QBZ16_000280 [Prototheca wickerhamii]|uniref:Spo11/DNA topoisomerase VI subunit A N-terminal domain-containing protein n=1 Tax=Prototheca wickerhamii TaxID=3111 RepID=A0AAD9IPQ8_PROWI|nr:hypothetical protein QBZ16_000280 [Prototheca wickerhamii]